MKELIEFIAKKLVEHPEDVQVRCIETEDGHQYELRVHGDDMGRVIGRDGRTAKALRTLLNTAAAKAEVEANLEIVDE
ncbi:MAG: KH domain-containing protein [Candidatus Hydrogenedentota bacterium]